MQSAGRDPDRPVGHSLPTAMKVIGFMTETGRETLQRPLPEGGSGREHFRGRQLLRHATHPRRTRES